MDQKISRKPVRVVMVRRGTITVPSVPTQKLKTFIRKKALLGSDEISGDGKSWVRVDRHYQLRKYFLDDNPETSLSAHEQGEGEEFEVSERPPDFENKLQQVADLLKDINE
ncbi:MAG: hypothetical protein VW455_10975 [Nitrospinota bacterium]